MTWHWLIYIFAFSFSAAVYILFSQYEAFFLFAMICMLPIISLVLSFIGRKLTKISMSNGTVTALRGETINLPITIKNSLHLPLTDIIITVREKDESGKILADNRIIVDKFIFSSDKLAYACKMTRCGRVEVYIDSVKFYDLLHLFPSRRKMTGKYVVLVMPRFYQSFINADMGNNMPQTTTGTAGELAGIRPYHYGDNSRYIHWKASTAHDDVYIREFYAQKEDDNVLLFDIDADTDEKSCNTVYEIFYAAGARLIDRYGGFTFCYMQKKKFLCTQYVNSMACFDRQLTAYMQAADTAGSMANLKGLTENMKQNCRHVFYVSTASENKIISTCGKMYDLVTPFIVGDNSLAAADGKAVFIDKSNVIDSLAEVWRI